MGAPALDSGASGVQTQVNFLAVPGLVLPLLRALARYAPGGAQGTIRCPRQDALPRRLTR